MNDTEKLIAEATSPDQIQELLHADRDAESTPAREPRQKRTETEHAEPVSRTETIGGREFTFEADSQGELDQMILNAYRVAVAVSETASEQSNAKEEAEAAAKAAVERSDLEIQFRRGQLTTAEYLQRTGAITEYLASQGVPVDELRETVQQQRSNAESQSWAQAVEQFLKSPAGADWPGGDANKEIIGLQLQALGLIEANDKVAALAQAYNVMKQRNTIVDGATGSENAAAQSTESQQATRQSIPVRQAPQQTQRSQQPQRQQSSSLWGSSSGTSANDMRDTSKDVVPASKIIPADARPEEILGAWKAGLMANNQNPDAEFVNAFRGRK